MEEVLRERILEGKYEPDSAFPTENELCQEFGVSRITVRQALMILTSDNLIRREQGRGTFLMGRSKGPKFRISLFGHVDDLFELGTHTTLKLHSRKLIQPDPDLAGDMGLKEGERLYLFEGVRHCYCEQFAFFQGYVPEEIGRNIQKREVQGPLLIECVERKALKKVKRAHQAISAMAAGEKIAKLIKVKKGSPLLVVKRIYFARSGNPLEMAITSFPGGAFQSLADLVKFGT